MLNAVVFHTNEFLAWIGGTLTLDARPMSIQTLTKRLSSSFCAVIRSHEPNFSRDGSVILIDAKNAREFFAFVTTYVPDYVPFSAFFRVITTEQMEILPNSDQKQQDLEVDQTVKTLVGIAIAEAALYLRARRSGDDDKPVTLAAINATYSVAALKGLLLGKAANLDVIGRNWYSLRSFVGGEPLPLDINVMTEFWKIIKAALYGNDQSYGIQHEYPIVGMLQSAMRYHTISDEVLLEILKSIPEYNGNISRFRGPREERTRAFQEAIPAILNSSRYNGQARAAIAGCLLSLLGDGSFKFLQFALSISRDLPMAPLWFAAWSSLLKTTDVMSSFNCIGRRVARDLTDRSDVFSIPVDDLSLDEMFLLGPKIDFLPRSQSGSISVEIYPNISSRQGLHKTAITGEAPRGHDFKREIKELRTLILQSSLILAQMDDKEVENGPESDRKYTKNPSNSRKKF